MKYLFVIILTLFTFVSTGCDPCNCDDDKHDGGDGDGYNGDAGDQPACFGDETDCANASTLLQCDLGSWEQVPCGLGKYCTDFGGAQKAACVDQCFTSADCDVQGFYCNQSTRQCEQQGDCREDVGLQKCDSTRSKVVMCEDESFMEVTIQECTAGVQYCDPQTAGCRDYCTGDAD